MCTCCAGRNATCLGLRIWNGPVLIRCSSSIKLTTAAPHSQTYEGTLSTACPILNLIFVERRDPNAQTSDFNVIPVARVQTFQIMALAEEAGFSNVQPPIAPIDYKRLEQRLEARVNKAKEEERNQGKGVTKEAQAIFDAFKRMYVKYGIALGSEDVVARGADLKHSNTPIRWHNQDMVVYDAVIIQPPYQPEDCKAPKEKQEALNRVRKVLEGERKKIRDREEKEKKAGTPTGQRLGG